MYGDGEVDGNLDPNYVHTQRYKTSRTVSKSMQINISSIVIKSTIKRFKRINFKSSFLLHVVSI